MVLAVRPPRRPSLVWTQTLVRPGMHVQNAASSEPSAARIRRLASSQSTTSYISRVVFNATSITDALLTMEANHLRFDPEGVGLFW